MLFHCLLGFIVFTKLAFNLIDIFIYVKSHFSVNDFKIITLSFNSWPWCTYVCISLYVSLHSLISFGLYVVLSFNHCFKYLSFPFFLFFLRLLSHALFYIWFCPADLQDYVHLSFFPVFFSLSNFHFSLSSILVFLYSAISDLLLSVSSEFLILVIVF